MGCACSRATRSRQFRTWEHHTSVRSSPRRMPFCSNHLVPIAASTRHAPILSYVGALPLRWCGATNMFWKCLEVYYPVFTGPVWDMEALMTFQLGPPGRKETRHTSTDSSLSGVGSVEATCFFRTESSDFPSRRWCLPQMSML